MKLRRILQILCDSYKEVNGARSVRSGGSMVDQPIERDRECSADESGDDIGGVDRIPGECVAELLGHQTGDDEGDAAEVFSSSVAGQGEKHEDRGQRPQ